MIRSGCEENGLADLAPVFDQQPLLDHDILAHREDALFKHRPHLVREPIVQFRAAAGISDALDSELRMIPILLSRRSPSVPSAKIPLGRLLQDRGAAPGYARPIDGRKAGPGGKRVIGRVARHCL